MSAAAFAVACLAAAAATGALAEAAWRAGLGDDPAAAPERKLQPRAVPAVGGAAILVGLLAASAAGDSLVPPPPIWPALLLAFALGLVDDLKRGGLSPLALLIGQTAAAAALLASGWRIVPADPAIGLVTSFLAVVVAMNCVNTFDNADGAATALGLLGLASRAPLAAAPLLGFLPFNLWLRRGRGPLRAPVAYLGNSGSHLLGVLLAVDPIGRAALLLPFLDLVRVAWARAAAGRPPWKGDRRHLAHRLQQAGLSPPAVVLLLVAIAVPAVLGAITARDVERSQSTLTLAAGAALTCALYAVAVLFSPRSQ